MLISLVFGPLVGHNQFDNITFFLYILIFLRVTLTSALVVVVITHLIFIFHTHRSPGIYPEPRSKVKINRLFLYKLYKRFHFLEVWPSAKWTSQNNLPLILTINYLTSLTGAGTGVAVRVNSPTLSHLSCLSSLNYLVGFSLLSLCRPLPFPSSCPWASFYWTDELLWLPSFGRAIDCSIVSSVIRASRDGLVTVWWREFLCHITRKEG